MKNYKIKVVENRQGARSIQVNSGAIKKPRKIIQTGCCVVKNGNNINF